MVAKLGPISRTVEWPLQDGEWGSVHCLTRSVKTWKCKLLQSGSNLSTPSNKPWNFQGSYFIALGENKGQQRIYCPIHPIFWKHLLWLLNSLIERKTAVRSYAVLTNLFFLLFVCSWHMAFRAQEAPSVSRVHSSRTGQVSFLEGKSAQFCP